jgi:hypothetical protein
MQTVRPAEKVVAIFVAPAAVSVKAENASPKQRAGPNGNRATAPAGHRGDVVG